MSGNGQGGAGVKGVSTNGKLAKRLTVKNTMQLSTGIYGIV